MPKLACVCGEILDLSPLPNPHGFVVLAEGVVEALVNRMVAEHDKHLSGKSFERAAYESFWNKTPGVAQAYECPKCGRIAVFGDPSAPGPEL